MTDEHAFADFVHNRAGTLYRFGYLLTGNHHDAEDLVQDALIRLRGALAAGGAAGRPGGIRPDDDGPPAHQRLASRAARVADRRRTREGLCRSRLEQAERSSNKALVWAALASLPPRQRAVLVLRYYEHLTDAEIAAVLAVSNGTVRSQASRALEKLRAAGAIELIGVIA